MIQKAAYHTKIAEIEKKIFDHDQSKYITTQEFNKLMADHFTGKLGKAKLATTGDIADFIKETNFDNKLKNINKKLI